MIIPVHMFAFAAKGDRSKIRKVEVPDNEWATAKGVNEILELVFKYGQNDFQNLPMPSVSVGDVVEVKMNEYFMVMACGFKLLTKNQYNKLLTPTSDIGYSFKDLP